MSIWQSFITACVLTLPLAPVPAGAANANTGKVSFYFAAHQDDWQLFMNPAAFEDLSGVASKTVFIHATAGDDGLGAGSGGRKHPYYLARENGALAAIRFMADADATPIRPFPNRAFLARTRMHARARNHEEFPRASVATAAPQLRWERAQPSSGSPPIPINSLSRTRCIDRINFRKAPGEPR